MIISAIRRPLFVALLAIAAQPGMVTAQPAAESGEAALPQGSEIVPAEDRDERLQQLFDQLRDASSENEAEPIAAEIRGLWARSGSDSMDLLLSRGRAAISEEDYPKARAHLSALTRLAPEFAEGWNAVATLNYLEKNYGRAVADIERTLAIEPRHFSALTGLALIFERTGQPLAAMKAWRQVNRIYPGLKNAQDAIDRLSPEVDGKGI
ncbi:MAG: tetratricopeptide repeat protein [Pseudomonadota bacterium]